MFHLFNHNFTDFQYYTEQRHAETYAIPARIQYFPGAWRRDHVRNIHEFCMFFCTSTAKACKNIRYSCGNPVLPTCLTEGSCGKHTWILHVSDVPELRLRPRAARAWRNRHNSCAKQALSRSLTEVSCGKHTWIMHVSWYFRAAIPAPGGWSLQKAYYIPAGFHWFKCSWEVMQFEKALYSCRFSYWFLCKMHTIPAPGGWSLQKTYYNSAGFLWFQCAWEVMQFEKVLCSCRLSYWFLVKCMQFRPRAAEACKNILYSCRISLVSVFMGGDAVCKSTIFLQVFLLISM